MDPLRARSRLSRQHRRNAPKKYAKNGNGESSPPGAPNAAVSARATHSPRERPYISGMLWRLCSAWYFPDRLANFRQYRASAWRMARVLDGLASR